MARYTASIHLIADTKALKKGFKQAKRGLKDVGSFVKRNSRAMLGAATAGAAAFGGLVAQGVAYGTTIDRMAEATGLAHEQISRLTYSSELYHASAEDVEKAVKRLSKGMYDAGVRGLATYQDAFDDLGIRIKNADGSLRAVDDVLLDFADVAATATDSTKLLGAGQDLLGRGVMRLLPWLKQGSAAIREQFEESDRLGNTIDAKLSKQLEKLGTNMKRLKLVGRGLGAVFADVVAEDIDKVVKKVMDAAAAFQELSPEMKRAAIATGGFTIAGLGMVGFLGLAWEPLKALVRLVKRIPAVFGAAAVAFGVLETGAQLAAGEFEKANDRVLDLLESTGEFSRGEFAKASFWAMLVAGIRGMGGGIASTLAQLELLYKRMAAPPPFIGPMPAPADGAPGGVPDPAAAAAALTYADALAATADAAAAAEPPLLRMGVSTYELGTHTTDLLGTYGMMPAVIGSVTSGIATMTDEMAVGAEGLVAYGGTLEEFGKGFQDFFLNMGPGAVAGFMSSMDSYFVEMAAKDLKFFDTLKKGGAAFLRETLMMSFKSVMAKMLATKIGMVASALMEGTLNWAALGAIPVILAAYGAGVAALSSIKSFAVGAKVQRGGAFSGYLDTGERLVNLRDFKQLVAAGSGGRNVTVNVTVGMEGTVLGSADADYEFERLADFIARRIDRE